MFASLLVVALIGAIAWAGSAIGLSYLFGVVLPYVAVVTFFLGVIWRMVYWAKSPVPFSIPTTGGQEKSLDFIKHEKWDCPNTKFGVVVRMFLEVCFFRSLFRNTAADVREFDPVTKGPRTIYYSSKWLWFFALLFHYCFLLVFIRHFRFFMDPVPGWLTFMESIDGIMQIGAPRFFWTGGLLLVAVLFLLARRLFNQRLRYISLMNDYFPLFLILAYLSALGIALFLPRPLLKPHSDYEVLIVRYIFINDSDTTDIYTFDSDAIVACLRNYKAENAFTTTPPSSSYTDILLEITVRQKVDQGVDWKTFWLGKTNYVYFGKFMYRIPDGNALQNELLQILDLPSAD